MNTGKKRAFAAALTGLIYFMLFLSKYYPAIITFIIAYRGLQPQPNELFSGYKHIMLTFLIYYTSI